MPHSDKTKFAIVSALSLSLSPQKKKMMKDCFFFFCFVVK